LSDALPRADETNVLLFELAGRRFATAAAPVRRVARRGNDTARFWDATALGAPGAAAMRGLVIACEAGEEALAVDAVHGMVAAAAVHALPAIAADCLHGGALAGLIEHEDELLPLVDLPALLRERITREP
jgi:hypothetical protein